MITVNLSNYNTIIEISQPGSRLKAQAARRESNPPQGPSAARGVPSPQHHPTKKKPNHKKSHPQKKDTNKKNVDSRVFCNNNSW